MYKVIKSEKISSNSYYMEVNCPILINKAMPGQFVIIMTKKDSERIPLTIYDIDEEKETLKLIYQVVGASTEELSKEKKEVFAVVGPLGNANIICENPKEYKNKRI